MPEIMDHVAYLSQEIGPRPAGTEEEQQAALYIAEQLQKDAGLSAVVEDFGGAQSSDAARIICCAVALVVSLLSVFVPVLGIPAIIITLITALLFAAEAFDRPLLSRVFSRGVSQNVVAKYEPTYSAETGGTRRRKVILVSRYDTGKVRAELAGPVVRILPILQWATLVGMVALPILLIIRNVFFLNAEGAPAVVLMVLIVLALIPAILLLVVSLLHKFAAYNEGANCNASGTAVLLEIARRVGRGRVADANAAQAGVIHGEEAARAAGLVPEGAQLVYEAAKVKPPEIAPQTPEARLAAAKAAVAALSGKPVSNTYSTDLVQNLVQVKEPPIGEPTDEAFREQRGETREALQSIPPETMQAALAHAENAAAEGMVSMAEGAGVAGAAVAGAAMEGALQQGVPAQMPQSQAQAKSADGVPDWFKKAQEKAKKPKKDDKPVQRSRYASALDAAVSESAGHFAVANEIVEHKLEQSFASRDDIREVKAPQWTSEQANGASDGEFVSGEAAAVSEQAAFTQAQAQANTQAQASAQAKVGAQVQAQGQAAMQPGMPNQPGQPQSVAAGALGQEGMQASGAIDASAIQNVAVDDPFATTAMPPLDASAFDIGSVPATPDVPMPSFLDPRKVQEQTRAALQEEQRTNQRVNVTSAPIGADGRLVDVPAPDLTAPQPARRPIELPDIPAAVPNLTPITELPKQRAPLAEVSEKSGKSAAKSLLTMLPSISVGAGQPSDEAAAESAPAEKTASKESLRELLPSLSGAIRRTEVAEGAASSVSAVGSFVPAGATGAFAPVGDELLQNVDPNDIYVEDADDSAFEDNVTETGAFAGPGYVEMPKSRAHRLFDRFRRKKKDEMEPTPQEWLEVDETFDARTVGAERGGWESFRPEDDAAQAGFADAGSYDAGYDEAAFDESQQGAQSYGTQQNAGSYGSETYETGVVDDAFYEEDIDDGFEDEIKPKRRRPWQGGAFSSRRAARSGFDEEDDFLADIDDGPASAGVPQTMPPATPSRSSDAAAMAAMASASSVPASGNAFGASGASLGTAMPVSAPVDGANVVSPEVQDELQSVHQFHNGTINTEVWFVALGSELAKNAGMQAFIDEHQQDLRGAIIVDVDALGAGELCLVDREGMYRSVKTSSRMNRYVKKASQATGLRVGSAQLKWQDSAASVAIKRGLQALHLVGMDGAKPAFYAQANDMIENVDEETLQNNADFVMELLKNI